MSQHTPPKIKITDLLTAAHVFRDRMSSANVNSLRHPKEWLAAQERAQAEFRETMRKHGVEDMIDWTPPAEENR